MPHLDIHNLMPHSANGLIAAATLGCCTQEHPAPTLPLSRSRSANSTPRARHVHKSKNGQKRCQAVSITNFMSPTCFQIISCCKKQAKNLHAFKYYFVAKKTNKEQHTHAEMPKKGSSKKKTQRQSQAKNYAKHLKKAGISPWNLTRGRANVYKGMGIESSYCGSAALAEPLNNHQTPFLSPTSTQICIQMDAINRIKLTFHPRNTVARGKSARLGFVCEHAKLCIVPYGNYIRLCSTTNSLWVRHVHVP